MACVHAAARFQLIAQGIEIAEYGGIGFAALEFGEALLEVIEQPRGVGAQGRGGLRYGQHGAEILTIGGAETGAAPAHERQPGQPYPGVLICGQTEIKPYRKDPKAHNRRDQPKFAHAIDIIRVKKPRQYR